MRPLGPRHAVASGARVSCKSRKSSALCDKSSRLNVSFAWERISASSGLFKSKSDSLIDIEKASSRLRCADSPSALRGLGRHDYPFHRGRNVLQLDLPEARSPTHPL